MRGRSALFDPPDVEHGRGEVYLRPFEGDKLGCPQSMPVGEQDHSRVPMAVSVAFGRRNERFHFACGQMLAGPNPRVRHGETMRLFALCTDAS